MSNKVLEIKDYVNDEVIELLLKYDKEITEELGRRNFKHTAIRYCEVHGYPFNDDVRRKVSLVINRYEKNKGIQLQETILEEVPPTKAKVLFFDLETSFLTIPVFQIYNNNYTAPSNILQDWKLLTFSYKWMGEKEVTQHKLTELELTNNDDSRLVKELWELMDEASIVIAHNGSRFDVKKATAKFFEHGYGLPSPYQIIDTLALAKKSMQPTSFALDYFAKLSGSPVKMETSQGLWLRAIKGDYTAIEEMAEYCDQDIVVLEQVFYKLRPYLKGLPNMGLFTEEEDVCPSCGSTDFLEGDLEPYRTSVNEFMTRRCACCGSISKSRTATKRTNKVKNTPIYR